VKGAVILGKLVGWWWKWGGERKLRKIEAQGREEKRIGEGALMLKYKKKGRSVGKYVGAKKNLCNLF